MTQPAVIAVSVSPTHTFSKVRRRTIRLLKDLGVEGDAHLGTTVKHRSRVAIDPSRPNLRQVHLIQSELFAELEARGFSVRSGDLGENITTRGLDLLALPRGAHLRLGTHAIVEITGLRNPCSQLDAFQQGLTEAVVERDPHRGLIRKAGIMAIVVEGGDVQEDDPVVVELPEGPHEALTPV